MKDVSYGRGAYRNVSSEHFSIWVGILPPKKFFCSLISLSEIAPSTSEGMLPLSLLLLKSRMHKDLSSPILTGIDPEILLVDKFKTCKLLRPPIPDGSWPKNAFDDKSKTWRP